MRGEGSIDYMSACLFVCVGGSNCNVTTSTVGIGYKPTIIIFSGLQDELFAMCF